MLLRAIFPAGLTAEALESAGTGSATENLEMPPPSKGRPAPIAVQPCPQISHTTHPRRLPHAVSHRLHPFFSACRTHRGGSRPSRHCLYWTAAAVCSSTRLSSYCYCHLRGRAQSRRCERGGASKHTAQSSKRERCARRRFAAPVKREYSARCVVFRCIHIHPSFVCVCCWQDVRNA